MPDSIPLQPMLLPTLSIRLPLLYGILLLGGAFAQSAPRLSGEPPAPLPALLSAPPTSDAALAFSDNAATTENQPDASALWKDDGTALLWSVGATVLPVWAGARLIDGTGGWGAFPGVLLFIGGLAAGPSAGQWYLGSYRPGALGMLIRLPGMVLVAAGFAEAVGSLFCGMDFGGNGDDANCPEENGSGKMEAGLFIYLAGTAYSLIDIPFAAKRKQARESRFGLAPILHPNAQGGTSQGLLAWARF